MDELTLTRLDFHKILERIASYATNERGRKRIADLRPFTQRAPIERHRDTVTEAVDILRRALDIPLVRFADPAGALALAAIEEARLAPGELLQIHAILKCTRRVAEFFGKHRAECPNLWALAGRLAPLPNLEHDIEQSIEPDESIRDSASPALGEIRRSIESVKAAIHRKLDRMLAHRELSRIIVGDNIALRNGRYVLPVQATQYGRIRGIVHDRSRTEQTVYLEPEATIELGNELAGLSADEQREIARILTRLTTRVRENLDFIQENTGLLADIDHFRACARYSAAHKMNPPDLIDEPRIHLRGVRHPLLEAHLDSQGHRDRLVPLDFDCGGDWLVVAVTGANAGGKTVALKTVGLVCLMAQAGLHVPAEPTSRLGIFRRLLADIGDSQSIEESLSTFSGHVTRIKKVIEGAAPATLILLDELGQGTDPAEGSALACAVMKAIADRGAIGVVTTHLAAVKAYAHEHPRMTNAAVQFDPATLEPTFHVVMGQPGASHGMAIAARFGIPTDVLNDARGFLDGDAAGLGTLISSLNHARLQAQRDRNDAARAREEAEKMRRELEERLDRTKAERREVLREAHEEAGELLKRTSHEMAEIVRAAREKPDDERQIQEFRERIRKQSTRSRQTVREMSSPRGEPLPIEEITEGRRVLVGSLELAGTVTAVNRAGRRVRLEAHGSVFEIDASDIYPGEDEPVGPKRRRATVKIAVGEPPAQELMLIGMHVHEAEQALEAYFGRAALSPMGEVRIVHGFGTGTLRRVVSDYLKRHPQVASFRPGGKGEGGAGATVATLKNP